MSTPALIGLGSNLGDRKANLDAAVTALAETPGIEVAAVSSYHETTPVGGPGSQGAYLNAALTLETSLSPSALLAILQEVENRHGRVREARWDKRTLDLDLILLGPNILETPHLTVPHPRFAIRRFVLAPSIEVAPTFIDPITGKTIDQLLTRLSRRPSYLALDFNVPRLCHQAIVDPLVERLPGIGLIHREGPRDPEARDQPEAPPSDPAAQLEHCRQRLLNEHWHTQPGDDRWLVSDFWFDRLYMRSAQGDDRERFVVRSQLIEPTFVASIARAKPNDAAETHDPDLPRLRLGGPPVVRIESSTAAEVVEEILACCASTR
jgi:2-amino-4-hydroxy-6-hydroxymethyldihydropteridine diphosphokinase